MESLSSDSVYKIDMFKSLPDALLEKCAFLSVRPDTVKNLVQAMQGEIRHTNLKVWKKKKKHEICDFMNYMCNVLFYSMFLF